MTTKQVQRETLDEIYHFIGLSVAALVLFALVNVLGFGLLGYLVEQAAARIAILVVLWTAAGSFVLGYRIGHRAGEEHVRGVQTGIEMKVAAQTRPAAAPKTAAAFTPHNPPAPIAPEQFEVAIPKTIAEDW